MEWGHAGGEGKTQLTKTCTVETSVNQCTANLKNIKKTFF